MKSKIPLSLAQGAARFPIASAEEAAALIRRANQARAVEATAMNAVSSRSHSVFMIYVTGAHEGTGTRLTGACLWGLVGGVYVYVYEKKYVLWIFRSVARAQPSPIM